jgi:hypothetical protein
MARSAPTRQEAWIELSADNSDWIRLSVVPAFRLMATHQGHVSVDLEAIEGRFVLNGEASSLSLVEVRRNTGGRKDRRGIGEAQRRRRLRSEVVQTLGFFVIELLGRTLFRALKQDHGVFDLVSVRISVPETLAPEDPDDSFRFDLETGLLSDFPNDGLRRVLAWFYRSSRQTPTSVLLFLKQDPSGFIPNNRRDSRD